MWGNFMGDPYDCLKEWVNLSSNEKWKLLGGMVWLLENGQLMLLAQVALGNGP